jgi:hypothetical protein
MPSKRRNSRQCHFPWQSKLVWCVTFHEAQEVQNVTIGQPAYRVIIAGACSQGTGGVTQRDTLIAQAIKKALQFLVHLKVSSA